MTSPLQVDIAPAAYAMSTDPGVLTRAARDGVVVVLCDAAGAWGDGMLAAGWARQALAERWADQRPATMDFVLTSIAQVCRDIPQQFREHMFGCNFDGVALLVSQSSVHVAAAGAYTVSIVGDSIVVPVFRPRMLTDQLIDTGSLSPGEVGDFAHQDICVGPFLPETAAMARSGPHEIPAGHVLVVVHRRLLSTLLQDATCT